MPAIDGLRAVAVLSVLVFHLRARWMPGGYVGVDIFFVISGFVVSLSMLERGLTNFAQATATFYARRLRRILPALLVMLLVTSLATVALVPNAWLGKANRGTALAAFFGVSNLVLARQDDQYFEATADFNPFLHTWSLGVEEQFYLLFPALMVLQAAGKGSRWRALAQALVLLLSIGSLAVCAYQTPRDLNVAYYGLPSRFWELGLGVWLAQSRSMWQPWLATLGRASRAILALTAFGTIGLTLAYADAAHFPFPWAVPPVFATILLLALIYHDGALPTLLPLAGLPAVTIGKLSYSLYLWHWPIYALLRWTTGLDSPLMQVLAVAGAFAAAAISYTVVEQPVRRAKRLAIWPKPFVITAFIGLVLIGAGLSRWMFEHSSIMSLSVTKNLAVWSPYEARATRGTCKVGVRWSTVDSVLVTSMQPDGCGTGPTHRLWVVGDSHANVYSALTAQLVVRQNLSVEIRSMLGCAVLELRTPDDPSCLARSQKMLDIVLQSARPGDIVFFPSLRLDRYADQYVDGPIQETNRGPDRGSVEASATYLRALAGGGVNVVLEAPPPVFRAPPFRCADWFNHANPVCRPGFAVSRKDFDTRRADVLVAEADLARIPNVHVWDPAAVLCGASACDAFRDGKPLFFDGDHLSGYGDQVLYASFAAAIDGLVEATKP